MKIKFAISKITKCFITSTDMLFDEIERNQKQIYELQRYTERENIEVVGSARACTYQRISNKKIYSQEICSQWLSKY